jgi:hypothetical protein
VQSDHEFAIPLVDTTVKIGDFVTFPYPIDTPIEIPEGTAIRMGELSYPFFIGDYASSQEMKWLEPRMILETNDFPSGTVVQLKIYIKRDDGTKYYFWLSDDYSVTLTNTSVKIPDTPDKITDISQFRSAKRVFIDVSITYPVSQLASEILHDKISIKFAIKFEIKTDLRIKL